MILKKFHHRTGHEGPEEEWMYSLTPLTSVLDGDVWSTQCPGHFTPGKDPVPIVQEAGQAPGPVRTVVNNLAPTGICSPDCPARSESLYRLRYPGPQENDSANPKFWSSRFFFCIASVTFLRPFVLFLTCGLKFHFLYGIRNCS